jgi:hypothetical protein
VIAKSAASIILSVDKIQNCRALEWYVIFILAFLILLIVNFHNLFSKSICPSMYKISRLLVGKPEGKRPLERPRRRCLDNIKMDFLKIGLNVVQWIGLAQDRYRWRALVNSVMNLRVP